MPLSLQLSAYWADSSLCRVLGGHAEDNRSDLLPAVVCFWVLSFTDTEWLRLEGTPEIE